MTLPLAGLRVLDLTHVAAGPFCSSMLGQLGADVIKIEPLGAGELMRGTGPFIGDGALSFYFAAMNAEKRFVQINLKADEGRRLFLAMAAKADIIVQNLAPDAVVKLGIDYDVIRTISERLIYCSIQGFRPGSVYDGLPSFDYIHEALSGVMSITRNDDQAPPLPGLPAADMSAGLYAALSIVLALRVRDQSGRGQHIIVPLQDCLTSLLPLRLGYSHATGQPFPNFGPFHQNFAPFGVYATADSFLVLTAGSGDLWRALIRVIPSLDVEAFDTAPKRVAARADLNARLEAVLKHKDTATWVRIFREAGVPAAPILDTDEVINDPYYRERAVQCAFEGGAFTWQPFPALADGFSTRLGRAPGKPGADTHDVLREFGLSPREVEGLKTLGIIN